jgi:glycerophosphoryl diester phosphodiesterase
LRLAELRQLTVGGEPIPTLEEVLKTQDRPEGLLIELKSEMWNDVRVAARTAKVLRETRALDRGAVVASSFNPVCLLTLWRLNPSIPRGLLAHRKGPVFLRRAWFRGLVGASELHMEACLITPRWARAAHRAGRRLVAWTVNDVEEARRLQKLGVDGVITDTPGALRQALALAPT